MPKKREKPRTGEARRYPWKPVAQDGTETMEEVLPSILKRLGLDENMWTQALADEWPALVGADVAKHTKPGRVNQAHLVVFVDNSVWLGELARFGKTRMLANLQKRFGATKIKTLSFQLNPDVAL